jgi:hypothetical protein
MSPRANDSGVDDGNLLGNNLCVLEVGNDAKHQQPHGDRGANRHAPEEALGLLQIAVQIHAPDGAYVGTKRKSHCDHRDDGIGDQQLVPCRVQSQ